MSSHDVVIKKVDPQTVVAIRDVIPKDFPRQLTFHGAVYDCAGYPRDRCVELTPANEAAKRQNAPQAWMLPHFRGFKVKYRQASRVVSLR